MEGPDLVGVATDVLEAAVEGAGARHDLESAVAVDVADGRAALERLGAASLPDLGQLAGAVEPQGAEHAAGERLGDGVVPGGVAADEDLHLPVPVHVIQRRGGE